MIFRFPILWSTPLKTNTFLLIPGLLLSAMAQAVTNDPPPPDDPPTTCSTGRQSPQCGSEAPRGYRLLCPNIRPNTIVSVIRYICQPPGDPVIPHIECEQLHDSVLCEAFPIDATGLIFQWTLDVQGGGETIPFGDQNRFLGVDCSVASWSGNVTVQVINELSGASSTKTKAVTCINSRSAAK